MAAMLLLILCAAANAAAGACTAQDALVYARQGHEFKTAFRSYGGIWVDRDDFRRAIMDHYPLTEACAGCFADAYACGKDKCYYTCAIASAMCDRCLVDEGCTTRCNACTGLLY